MNTESTTVMPDMPSSGRLIATLAVIAMLSGFFVVLVYQATLERIALNHREYLERAVFTVLPGATVRVNFSLSEAGLQRLPDDAVGDANVFAGYNDDGTLVGVALQASARGYADVIRILYGYAPDREAIVGFTVLQSSETPGLGDKIETDPAFLRNFENLQARLNEEGTALENDIVTVKQSTKTEDWQIDGITGATVSAVAVGRALRESANEMLPLLAIHHNKLADPPRPSAPSPGRDDSEISPPPEGSAKRGVGDDGTDTDGINHGSENP